MARNTNAFIIGGIAIALVSILLTSINTCEFGMSTILMPDRYSGQGTILGTSVETRWPMIVAALAVCWGLYQRRNSS